MKINDLLKEGFYDNPSTSNATGQKYFIDSVTKQIHAYIESVRKTGQPLQMWDFVNSYLTKYGWTANPEQTKTLQTMAKEVENEYNYFLQKQEKPAKPAGPAAGEKAFGQMANQLQQPDKSGANAFDQMSSQLAPGSWPPSKEGPAVWKSGRTGQPMPAAQKNWAPSPESRPFFKSGRTGKQMDEGIAGDMWQGVRAKAGTMAGKLASKMGFGSVDKLAHAMYAVGMTQHRDPKSGRVVPGAKGDVDNPVLANPTKQILNTMKPMKGEDYKDDLESIVRLALGNLWKTDPADYSTEIKRIMGQKPNQQQQQQNPQA